MSSGFITAHTTVMGAMRLKLEFLLHAICISMLLVSTGYSQTSDLPPDIGNDFTFHSPPQKLPGRIAFTTTIGKYERIFVVDLESGSIYPIIAGPENNKYPSWSPDGKRLAFASDRNGVEGIYHAQWDGSRVRQIRSITGKAGDPSWHYSRSTGAQILFYIDAGGETNIHQSSPWATNKIIKLTSFGGRNLTPRLSPDGQSIAYSTDRFWPGWDVCIYDLQAGVETCPLKGKESFCRPAWHSDGKKLLFASGGGKNIDIGIHDLETGLSRFLTRLPNREYDPVWAPDFKSFAFVAEPTKLNHFQLYVFIDGERDPRLLVSGPYPIRYLAWDKNATLKLEAQRIRELDKARKKEKKPAKVKRQPVPSPEATLLENADE